MKDNVRMAGAATALLLVLTSCATTPAPADTATGQGATPCHDPYVADIDTSAPGEATPEAAAVAWSWSKSILTPSDAPNDGWKATDDWAEQSGERTVRNGDWVVGVSRTVSGGWLVSGLGCGTAEG